MALLHSRQRAIVGVGGAAATAYRAYSNASPAARNNFHRAVSRGARSAYAGVRSAFNSYRSSSRANVVNSRRYTSSRVPRSNTRSRYSRSSRRRGVVTRKKRRRGRISRRGKSNTFMSKIWKSLCTPMTYKSTLAQAYSGVQGQRQFKFIELAGEEILLTLGNKHPSNFLFNTALNASSTASLTDPGGSNYKLCVDKFLWDFRLQNRANACMELKIYECLVRNNINSTGYNAQSASAMIGYFQDSMDPPTYIGGADSNIGPGQTVFPTGVTHAWQHPSFTPYMSNEFVSFFRIIKTHSLSLDPNEIRPMKFALGKKCIDGVKLNSASNYEYERGWSKVLCFSWVGMPVDDGSVNNQTKAKTDLFFQADILIKYHFTPGTEPLYNLSFANDINGIGQQYVFNPAGMVAVVPASDTVQTIAATALPTGQTDSTAEAAP